MGDYRPAIYYQSAYIHLLAALMPVQAEEPELRIIHPQPHPLGIAYGFEFSFMAQPEEQYIIEYTDHLHAPAWHMISNIVTESEASHIHILDPPPLPSQRFYRIHCVLP